MTSIGDIKNMLLNYEYEDLKEVKHIVFEEDEHKISNFFNQNKQHIELYHKILTMSKSSAEKICNQYLTFMLMLCNDLNIDNYYRNNNSWFSYLVNKCIVIEGFIDISSKENLEKILISIHKESPSYTHCKIYEIAIRKNIDLTPYLEKIIERISYSKNVSDELVLYVVDNVEDIPFGIFITFVERGVFLDKLQEKEFKLKTVNGDYFLAYCFHINSRKDLLMNLIDRFGYNLTDIKEDLIYLDEDIKPSIKAIEFLSTLENFDDFVNNNLYELTRIIDKESFEFIRTYL